MFRFLSNIIAACFLLISVSASFSAGYAELGKTSEISVVSQSVEHNIISGALDRGKDPVEKKDECPCKKKNGSFTSVCGVSMALSGAVDCVHMPMASKTIFQFSDNDLESSLQDLLKRPPRTIL